MPDENGGEQVQGEPSGDVLGTQSQPANPGPNQKETNTEKLEKDIKRGEWWLIRIGIATLAMNSLIAYIYYQQLTQMRIATQVSARATQLASDALKYSDSHFDRSQQQTITQTVASVKAANAAKSASDTAKSTLIASQGAYITIGRKDGLVAEFVTSKDHPDENVPLIVYFQNTGHIPATVAWDTSDRKEGASAESFGIHRFTTGMGRAPLPPVTLHKGGNPYEVFGKVIAGDSVGRNELAYISQSDLEKLSKKIAGFYIDGYYSYCDRLGTWSTHEFTLNYHTDVPTDLRFELMSDIEIANPPIPKSYFPPCTSIAVMREKQQYASNAK